MHLNVFINQTLTKIAKYKSLYQMIIITLSNVITGDKAMTYQAKTAVNTATTSDNPNTQPATLDTLPTDGFIRVMPLAQRLGIHHQTLRRWWKNGLFPKPQHRNGILLFSNLDVKEWIAIPS